MWSKKNVILYSKSTPYSFSLISDATGSSSRPCSDYYAGPKAFSEPETKAVSEFMLDNLKGRLLLFLDFHSHSHRWLTPYGYSSKLPPNYQEQVPRSWKCQITIFIDTIATLQLFPQVVNDTEHFIQLYNDGHLQSPFFQRTENFPPYSFTKKVLGYLFELASHEAEPNLTRNTKNIIDDLERTGSGKYHMYCSATDSGTTTFGRFYTGRGVSGNTVIGGGRDWVYDVICAKYSYVVELRDKGEFGFILPRRFILPTAMETWEGVKAMGLDMAEKLYFDADSLKNCARDVCGILNGHWENFFNLKKDPMASLAAGVGTE
ncbi:hypothetical protein AVEN_265691-1 [Araneus ventricosus]|uniref:Peptidase M14 domain-containing protein n=1 Tax=Araneus ventricosus TaxID=182803 RepID=A0A4Y2KBJ8_ARAVE|nr:hypothetical protein AVEN_265691-1 [Araneus ventricosus]